MTKKKAIKEALKHGATIEVEYADGTTTCYAVAPDDRVWEEGPGVLVSNYGETWGPAADAWQDLIERMWDGLQPE